nr:MAG TPA: hypothetical protein [Caudoviricetes sp.]
MIWRIIKFRLFNTVLSLNITPTVPLSRLDI